MTYRSCMFPSQCAIFVNTKKLERERMMKTWHLNMLPNFKRLPTYCVKTILTAGKRGASLRNFSTIAIVIPNSHLSYKLVLDLVALYTHCPLKNGNDKKDDLQLHSDLKYIKSKTLPWFHNLREDGLIGRYWKCEKLQKMRRKWVRKTFLQLWKLCKILFFWFEVSKIWFCWNYITKKHMIWFCP